ncbi:hypothetical protein ACHAQJ_008767 [Trichoderma viride]
MAGKVLTSQKRKRRGLLPPGPPGEPILGHLRIIPTDNPEYFYMKLSQKFKSDILSFNIHAGPTIAIGLDLFFLKSWDGTKTLTFLRWGSFIQIAPSDSTKKLSEKQHWPVPLLARARSPGAGPGDLGQAGGMGDAIALGVGFGIKIEADTDPFVQVAADASYALGHGGAPAGTPIDYFPLFKLLPSFFHDRSLKFAMKWKFAIVNLRDKPYEAVVSSTARIQSLVQDMLDQQRGQANQGQTPEISEEDIKGAGAAVFAAGQDTTWSTLVVFILNMVLHPKVQIKAQQILNKVVGQDRLPTFDNRPNLQYIDFIVQKTLRWCPISPMGVPHRSLKDDVYGDYLIPAGSFVYANARAMTHDERIYKNPDDFDPDRYSPVEEGGRGEPLPGGAIWLWEADMRW